MPAFTEAALIAVSAPIAVIIPVEKDQLSIVVTDGFHFTRPLKLAYDQPGYFNLEVACIVDDLQLPGGSLLLVICFLLALFTGFLVLKILSFLPIIWFLFFYYVNRKDFLQIKKAGKRIKRK